MLKGFEGVLVSDFYSAYDGLPRVQQRCLIHLMRDMNRMILDNPFDQELQSITAPFGSLLRSIIATVDAHGLKRRSLRTHTKAVAAFFDVLAEQVCESDASTQNSAAFAGASAVVTRLAGECAFKRRATPWQRST